MGSGSGGSAISIHAPHTGRDSEPDSMTSIRAHFNPRAPYGARPVFLQFLNLRVGISIHAPHTGRDHCVLRNPGHSQRISIHAPHTGRDRRSSSSKRLSSSFQSTRPIRGATFWVSLCSTSAGDFNPRAPYGARLYRDDCHVPSLRISIHAPHTGRDSHPQMYEGEILFNVKPRAPYGARPSG